MLLVKHDNIMKERLIKHGNQAKVNPKYPNQINGKYYTNVITYNKTLSDGSVVNVFEDNAEIARDEANDIRLS